LASREEVEATVAEVSARSARSTAQQPRTMAMLGPGRSSDPNPHSGR